VDPFEYFIGLYTIIVGLGIALLVRSVGQMIEGAGRIRLYWVHTGWLLLIFVTHVMSWFFLWKYHGITQWKVPEALLLLLVPVLLYLASHLAVPEIEEYAPEKHDLRAYYFGRSRYRWIQGLVAAAIIATLLIDWLMLGEETSELSVTNRFVTLAVLVPGILSPRPAIHQVQLVVMLGLVVVATALGLGQPIS